MNASRQEMRSLSRGLTARLHRFDLPESSVAQEPPEALGGARSDARLVVLDRASGQVAHRVFRDLPALLEPADVLVLNNSRVVPTLLHGRDATGRTVVVSVFSRMEDGTWHCLVAPRSAGRPGSRLALGSDSQLTADLLHAVDGDVWQVAIHPSDPEAVYRQAEPIYPGYLERPPSDPEHYQTVYASRPGSVLFPSAGRHFTPALLAEIRRRGVAVVEVSLHLAARSTYFVERRYRDAAGTPVGPDDQPRRPRHTGVDFPRAERYEVTREAATAINERRRLGGRVVVCGTSALRALETTSDAHGTTQPGSGMTRLTITPLHRFRACDAFLTNLHRPQSSELVLTAAFAGRRRLLRVYRNELVPGGYRFHEFGDAMLVT